MCTWLEAGRRTVCVTEGRQPPVLIGTVDTENDWKLVSEPMKGVNGRQVKLSRGRFLGGSSGVNGTLVIKGTKQDYDDWEYEPEPVSWQGLTDCCV